MWQHYLKRLSTKVVTTCYRRVDIYVRDLEDMPCRPLEPEFEIRLLEPRDLAAYQRMRPRRPKSEASDRFSSGDQCMAVWHASRIVHASWISTRRVYVPYLERELLLLPADIYIHDIYTLPSYRGRGVASARGAHLIRHYRARGFRRGLAIVATENELGAAQVRALQYRQLGRYSFLRLGPLHRELEPFPKAAGRLL